MLGYIIKLFNNEYFEVYVRGFLYSIQNIFPEDGTPAPKHVVILTVVMNCILLREFVGGCVDCKAMQGIKNSSIKFAKRYVALADRVV